jgi:preprotein translocase subunit SecY
MDAFKKAIDAFVNAFKIEDLRKKLLFTLGVLIIYRIGSHISIPGVDPSRLAGFFSQNSNNLFGLYDSFTGGAFAKATIFALGIMPYISASIIIQLMGSVIPQSKCCRKKARKVALSSISGRAILRLFLAAVQAWGISVWLSNIRVNTGGMQGVSVLLDDFASGAGNWGFRLLATLTMTTGTIFVMYLGEQITSRGVGNGISLIIFAGIVGSLPLAAAHEFEQFMAGNQPLVVELFVIAAVDCYCCFHCIY